MQRSRCNISVVISHRTIAPLTLCLFSSVTVRLACVAGVKRGGRGKGRKTRDWGLLLARFSLLPSPFLRLPHRLQFDYRHGSRDSVVKQGRPKSLSKYGSTSSIAKLQHRESCRPQPGRCKLQVAGRRSEFHLNVEGIFRGKIWLEWCIWNESYVNCGYEIKWRMILAVVIAIFTIA